MSSWSLDITAADSHLAWMVRKKNPKLTEYLNTFIRARRKGTKLGNILIPWTDPAYAIDAVEFGCDKKTLNAGNSSITLRNKGCDNPHASSATSRETAGIDSIFVMGFAVTAVTVIANVSRKRLSISGKKGLARRWDGTIIWCFFKFFEYE